MKPESQLIERDRLLVELAFAVGPVRRLATDPHWQTRIPYVETRFKSEIDELANHVATFCAAGSIGNSRQYQEARSAVYALADSCTMMTSADGLTAGQDRLGNLFDRAFDTIRALPCGDVATIMPGLSPFTTYLQILALGRSARTRIDVFDPYLDKEVYDRYLGDIDSAVTITVITDDARMTTQPPVRDRIVAVSELLAIERPRTYRFCVATSLHDRHLRIDDQVLHLGGSLKMRPSATRTRLLAQHRTRASINSATASSQTRQSGLARSRRLIDEFDSAAIFADLALGGHDTCLHLPQWWISFQTGHLRKT
jgi:hypothetical protein